MTASSDLNILCDLSQWWNEWIPLVMREEWDEKYSLFPYQWVSKHRL